MTIHSITKSRQPESGIHDHISYYDYVTFIEMYKSAEGCIRIGDTAREMDGKAVPLQIIYDYKVLIGYF